MLTIPFNKLLCSYSSHVLRSIFQCLAGFQLSKDLLRSKKSQGQAQTNLDLSKIETTESIFDVNDEEIQGVFALICKKVEDLEDINEICNYEISSEVLQCLLLVLCKKSGKLCKKLGKHITNEVFAGKYRFFFITYSSDQTPNLEF